MHLLWETNSTIQDPQGHFNRPTNRATDTPLAEALPTDIFQMLRPQLRKHQLFWVGDIANRKGTKPTNPKLLGISKSQWRETLMSHLVSASTGDLFDKVSPAPAPLNPTTVTHRPGTVVTMPWQNTDWSIRPPQHNFFYKVKRTSRDLHGREVCHLTQLIPAPFRGHLILNPSTKRWN